MLCFLCFNSDGGLCAEHSPVKTATNTISFSWTERPLSKKQIIEDILLSAEELSRCKWWYFSNIKWHIKELKWLFDLLKTFK